MKRFYDYIYYRLYKTVYQHELKLNVFLRFDATPEPDKSHLNLYCAYYIGAVISMNIISLLFMFYILFESSLPTFYYLSSKSIIIIAIILSVIFYMQYDDNELYIQLDSLYKDEKHRKIKGWLVFTYISCSIIGFFYLLTCYNY